MPGPARTVLPKVFPRLEEDELGSTILIKVSCSSSASESLLLAQPEEDELEPVSSVRDAKSDADVEAEAVLSELMFAGAGTGPFPCRR